MNLPGGQSYSIVVETDNLSRVSREEFGGMLEELSGQIATATESGHASRPELIFVHDGKPGEAEDFISFVEELEPSLTNLARVRELAVPGGRYYELKNAGADSAGGDILVFLDSDVTPESGWLVNLLAPFESREVRVALGHTYLSYSDWVSRTLALIWVLP